MSPAMDSLTQPEIHRAEEADSAAAWLRLAAAVAIGTIGGVGMWSVVVALPAVQAEFGVARADAALPYTLSMLGYAFGGVLMGKLSDRYGIVRPMLLGIATFSLGYVLAGAAAADLTQFALAYGVLIGAGSSVTLGPLMADLSNWFERRRGVAVALVASSNYFAGTFWPPVVQHFIAANGWRATHVGIGVFCAATMLPIVLLLRRRPEMRRLTAGQARAVRVERTLALSPRALQLLLCVAGVACCVAMSMPQVHIVAYCGDLGYGVARGAEMLSLMLACGIVSRIGSGFLADRIGGLATLLIGSLAQGAALLLYLFFDGLASLYVISALFGFFQGGIVPMYAVIVRDYFHPREIGTRLGLVLMATLFGMALGGWMSGLIFDLTGSYRAAFANGLLWNLLNVTIVASLLLRSGRRLAPA
jgi:MFS family permease